MTPWLLLCLHALAADLYPRQPLRETELVAIAHAIDEAAHGEPLPGDDGVVRMAVELVVLAGTEGHLNPDALGSDDFGVSIGCWQLHQTMLPSLGARPADALDVDKAAKLAAHLIAKSHQVCARRPGDEALGWFASGGPTCAVPEGLAASRVRMRLAGRLRAKVPVFYVEERP